MSLLSSDVEFLRTSDRFTCDKSTITEIFNNPEIMNLIGKITENDEITTFYLKLMKTNSLPSAEILKILYNIQYAETNFAEESLTLSGINGTFDMKQCFAKYKMQNFDYMITFSVEPSEEIRTAFIETLNFTFFLFSNLKTKTFDFLHELSQTDKDQISIFTATCLLKYCNDIIGPCDLLTRYYRTYEISTAGVKSLNGNRSDLDTSEPYHSAVINTLNNIKVNEELTTFWKLLRLNE